MDLFTLISLTQLGPAGLRSWHRSRASDQRSDEAFEFFVTQVDQSDAKALFAKYKKDITTIYAQSELNNLRILQQTMWDFERVCRALTKPQRNNAEAMTALLRLIFALSFEIKAGRLLASDLGSRRNWLFAAAMDEPSKDRASRRRYPEIDLADQVLSDDALVDTLVRGIVDENAIRSCLERSRYFIRAANERPWVTVWHFFDRTDEEFRAAYERMEKQFVGREFTEAGELSHVLALRLFFARHGVSGEEISKVMDEGKHYIYHRSACHFGGRIPRVALQ